MKIKYILIISLMAVCQIAFGQADIEKYGTAKFESYQDIDGIKQLKVVWDFNFQDPEAIKIAFNAIGALMKATAEFGPSNFEPLKIVVVTHGPEVVVFDKRNFEKYKDLVIRANSLAQQGVKFEICRNAAAVAGSVPENMYGFATVVPAGPYALAYWQAKGYSLNAVGATVPTPVKTAFNKDTIH